jgi:acyl-CoA dehydrogenase
MDLALTKEDAAFRDEVRSFLDQSLPDELRAYTKRNAGVFADAPVALQWQKILHKKGWVVPSWPIEFGGTGWNDMQRYIYASELARSGAPTLPAMGLRMVGPVIMKYGTEKQKDFYLPRLLSGEDYWCQGYSEPGAGSDLAALQMKAVADGDDYVLNGTKIWTTHAQFANRIFCLVRTNTDGKPQQGITFILVDMDTPGIKVEPIITMAGDHEVNQVFFDDVRVPRTNRIGDENDGWTVAKYLLEFERGGAYAAGMEVSLENLRRVAGIERSDTGDRLIDDPSFKSRLADAEVHVTALKYTEHRVMAELASGQNPGPASSMLKTCGSEANQQLMEMGVEAIAYYATPDQLEARQFGANVDIVGPEHAVTTVPRYLNFRASTIYGGSNEVQRNIMAKLVLGL